MKKNPTSHIPHLTSQLGFTIIELLIFSAIFALLMMAFITILVAVTAVQTRQSAAAEVNQQSQFLLQQIQYYVEQSSLIELAQDAATSTLKLRMAASSSDPIYIYSSSSVVYLKQTDSGTPQPLSSNKVVVNDLTFTKRSNAPSHDSVAVTFTVAYNTSNPKQAFSQALQTAIARVNAATFDSNITPSSTNTYSLGTSGAAWTNINGVINFNGTVVTFSGSGVSVGIGATPTSDKLRVSGGNIYIDNNLNGLILRDTNNYCWLARVSTTGTINTGGASTTCP